MPDPVDPQGVAAFCALRLAKVMKLRRRAQSDFLKTKAYAVVCTSHVDPKCRGVG